jgi:hypothetical protein
MTTIKPAVTTAMILARRDAVIVQAQHIHRVARRKATLTERDETLNRSTRVQRAQRIKAQAFDEIGAILNRKA